MKGQTRRHNTMDEIKVLMLKPTVRVSEAARILDVSLRTVYRYIDAGRLPYVKQPGGQRRIQTAILKRYL